MATGTTGSSGGTFADRVTRALTGDVRASDSQIATASADASAAASQAGGYASDAVAGVRGVFSSAYSSLVEQEEQAATWLRWGTVALIALVLLAIVAVAAWFFAPARVALGAIAGRA